MKPETYRLKDERREDEEIGEKDELITVEE